MQVSHQNQLAEMLSFVEENYQGHLGKCLSQPGNNAEGEVMVLDERVGASRKTIIRYNMLGMNVTIEN